MHSVAFYVALGVSSGGGFLGNLFIILGLILPSSPDEKKGEHTINLTIGCMAVSKLILSITSVLWFLQDWLENICEANHIFTNVLMFIVCLPLLWGIWVTALLFLVYFAKIVPTRQPLLLKLKQNIPVLVHSSLLTGSILCTGMSIFSFKMEFCSLNGTLDQNVSTQLVSFPRSSPDNWIYIFIIWVVFMLLPQLVMAFSCITVMVYLSFHIRKMNSSSTEITNSHLESLKRTVQMMFTQLLLYTALITALFYYILICQTQNSATNNMYIESFSVYCLMTSGNLILTNSYMRAKARHLGSKLLSCCPRKPDK